MDAQQQNAAANYEQVAHDHFDDITKRLQSLPGATKPTTKNTMKGSLAIIVSGFGFVHVVMDVELADGRKLRFEGNGGGVIAGAGGVAYGGGSSTLSPSQLLEAGNMIFGLHATPIGMVMEFAGPGVFAGAGPNIASGHAVGSGRWTERR